jgi:hypothetical protein
MIIIAITIIITIITKIIVNDDFNFRTTIIVIPIVIIAIITHYCSGHREI